LAGGEGAFVLQGAWATAAMSGGSRWELIADLLALGRNEEAIAAAELAVSHWDRARGTPHWILGVGCSLNLLSRAHAAAGHWDAAFAAADEAVGIFRANGGGPDLLEALKHRATALGAMWPSHRLYSAAVDDEVGAVDVRRPR